MKKGVSLIILIVTVVVLTIITVITVQVTDAGFESVELTKFYEDLDSLNEAVFIYYTSNGQMPILETAYNMSSITALTENSDLFETQILANNDESDAFFQINMEVLALDTISIGTATTESDIFVIDEDFENIYYVKGAEVGEDYYYCINQIKISDNDTSTNNKNTSINIVSSAPSIKLTKSTNVDTSRLEVNVTTVLGEADSLQYEIGGITKTLSDAIAIINLPEDVTTGLSTTQLSTFKTAFSSNKTITVKKINNGQVIAISSLNLDNLKID